MYYSVTIAVPYSLREIFDANARRRLNELRDAALDACERNSKSAWLYICSPRRGWGDERSLFEQSLSSEEGHKNAMSAIGQMKHSLCA
jgi:hypothetical protein